MFVGRFEHTKLLQFHFYGICHIFVIFLIYTFISDLIFCLANFKPTEHMNSFTLLLNVFFSNLKYTTLVLIRRWYETYWKLSDFLCIYPRYKESFIDTRNERWEKKSDDAMRTTYVLLLSYRSECKHLWSRSSVVPCVYSSLSIYHRKSVCAPYMTV